jgi:hypothetical protein
LRFASCEQIVLEAVQNACEILLYNSCRFLHASICSTNLA